MASIQKTDMELQFDIFLLAKSFDELVKDMYNSSFSQTIIERKNELYSDYQRTNDGYLLLDTKDNTGILRVELQKQLFTSNVENMLGTKKYVFNPYFTQFVNTVPSTITPINQNLSDELNIAEQQLFDTQQQVQKLLQDVNSAINDKNNVTQNYDQIIQQINTQYAELQQQYNIAQDKIHELQLEKVRLTSLYMTASSLPTQE